MPRVRKDSRIFELQARHQKVQEEYASVKKERINLARTLWAEGWTKDQLLKGMNTTPIWLKQAVPELYKEEDSPWNI